MATGKGKVDLADLAKVELPSFDWTITDVLDDVIMCQLVDCDDAGEYVNRNGIMIKADPTKQVWRVGKVLHYGPECSTKILEGTHVIFPNNYGIHVPEVAGVKNVVFINEERIFGLCEAKKK